MIIKCDKCGSERIAFGRYNEEEYNQFVYYLECDECKDRMILLDQSAELTDEQRLELYVYKIF